MSISIESMHFEDSRDSSVCTKWILSRYLKTIILEVQQVAWCYAIGDWMVNVI